MEQLGVTVWGFPSEVFSKVNVPENVNVAFQQKVNGKYCLLGGIWYSLLRLSLVISMKSWDIFWCVHVTHLFQPIQCLALYWLKQMWIYTKHCMFGSGQLVKLTLRTHYTCGRLLLREVYSVMDWTVVPIEWSIGRHMACDLHCIRT